ncbi:anthrone oxygenase family protein [Nonomuraea sp. NPDC059194]|uniref:anthrone oxygenase family protein n=1 Tax=Nonomuraea sp. NPDC059194 TaxID=3346764 RepID=UPI0036AD94E4
MRTSARYVHGAALLATGLLAGAFGYGAANVIPTFNAVPMDVRLTFHTAMMQVNEPVMQSAMALAILSSFALAVLARGLPRRLALGAGSLAVSTLLVTVFGNVPLHAHFRQWAATSAPAGYIEIVQRWELFHTLRTLTAIAAFALIIAAAISARPSSR